MENNSPFKISRRHFLGGSLSAFALGVVLPGSVGLALGKAAEGAIKPGSRPAAFLDIHPDGTAILQCPFVEGGQGAHTGIAQLVGEELDLDPARFTVECARPGPDYLLQNGKRFTGGSNSIRSSYDTMRRLGASARSMLMQAASQRLKVPLSELRTEPGYVMHAATGRRLSYGSLAKAAFELDVPESVALKHEKDFRWIRTSVPRLDVRQKATGKVRYAIDLVVDNMLLAAVQHAPRLGMEPGAIANEAEVKAMRGVHSIHRLSGAVAVVADRWWRARRAAEALKVTWLEPNHGGVHAAPADFSTDRLREIFTTATGPELVAEDRGNVIAALRTASRTIEATYDAPYLLHAQLEPSSTIARWNPDGTVELWMPNQAPELFQNAAAKVANIDASKVVIHSPPLGGFFGRHFLYGNAAHPFPQAILLSKAVGRPVKVIWTREEESLRDALRPMGVARLSAGLDSNGLPVAMRAVVIGEGPGDRAFGRKPNVHDRTAVEGIIAKPYAVPNRYAAQVYVKHPATIGFWRSVGHSMNNFFSEGFFDEMADAGGHDPFELRLRLLSDQPRHRALLKAVGDLSGGWKRGPFADADGSRRARGVAMASPFGSEVATIAEVSVRDGTVVVHEVWVAFDLGRVVNPALVEAQVRSAVALGVSSTLLEEQVYVNGQPRARNFGAYPVLKLDRMPRVHVRIIESGAPMGGVGEPGLPGVPPAIVNAVAALTGRRVRSLPLSKTQFSATA